MPDPRRDTKSLSKLEIYLKKPRTIEQIMERFGLSWRTAYRWMDYLREGGTRVAAQRENKTVRFQIIS